MDDMDVPDPVCAPILDRLLNEPTEASVTRMRLGMLPADGPCMSPCISPSSEVSSRVSSMRNSKWAWLSKFFSPWIVMLTTVRTVSTGYRPRSVSAPSRMPSTPSRTAFATSVASARVGLGVLAIVSTTRVMNAGLPTMLQAEMIVFCTRHIFSGGMSRPMLPRDRMMPSAYLRMCRNSSSDCRVSILARILVPFMPISSRAFRAWMTSAAQRVKLRHSQSISNSSPMQAMASRSDWGRMGNWFCLLMTTSLERSM
mmetsp:Transcript_11605/g.29749  ORF Transcript_11605/g.29749 Transcript_11605/m.29749 type:complete len:256 (-) Transcript_11605:849-1616(-)